ncbi:MAG TPA: hypothetical protein VIL78_07415 [Hanamia sp.]
MTIIELKEKLIDKIRNTNDRELLNLIARAIQLEEQFEDIYVMSPGEIAAVEDGIKQIKNGQWVSHEEATKRIDEWLKKNYQA